MTALQAAETSLRRLGEGRQARVERGRRQTGSPICYSRVGLRLARPAVIAVNVQHALLGFALDLSKECISKLCLTLLDCVERLSQLRLRNLPTQPL